MTPAEDDRKDGTPEPMQGLAAWLRMKGVTALNVEDASALKAWADDVTAHTARIAALEAGLAALADAYAACNGEDHPAYVKARALIGGKP